MVREFEILFLMFIIYSCMGWIIETLFCFSQSKRFVNRGFLIGPYCPIYGTACMVVTILLKDYVDDPLVLFVLASVICTILEYITSYLMEKIFKTRWWDYSNIKFNINGRVCLKNSIIFGILCSIMMYLINPWIVKNINRLPILFLDWCTYVIMFIFMLDCFTTVFAMSIIRKISFEVKKDNTAEITKKVKEIIINNNNIFVKRLSKAFPNLTSTLKNKRKELEEKRLQIILKLQKNAHLTKYIKNNDKIRYKIRGEESEEKY